MREKRIKGINTQPLGQEGDLTDRHLQILLPWAAFWESQWEPMVLAGHIPGSWVEP